jgi:twitching motility two-component system response regulator PilH
MINAYKVLIIEGSQHISSFMATALSRAGYLVMTALNGDEGLLKVSRFQPHCLLLNLTLPDMNGFEACRRLRLYDPQHYCRIILFGNRNTSLEHRWGWRQGADHYLPMPFTQEVLIQIVSYVLSPGFHLPTNPQEFVSAYQTRPQTSKAQGLLNWNTIIPTLKEEPDLMISSNPFISAVVIANQQILSIYEAIDNQKSVAQLCHVTGLSLTDILSALKSLIQKERIELYTTDGTLIDSTQLFKGQY